MSLYIKTEDYRKYGIHKGSDLERVRAVVQRELDIAPLFVCFVNRREFIRVDFLKPRRRRRRPRAGNRGGRVSRRKTGT
ncbi:hypothetical protein SAMN02746041_02771 [Desulfacinum hydrothermale DSM 13146]|uniref:Uncharacterized protein n=1 Tax=Desulfacinum hydrothermale DSM 13146 TaxID=1121390 RepID=A0A1W1XS45_9BACT|nr:hypothetical protein [Desulfacinum hydrothermale]SMC26789.1 hypothetical protein SAMN02746041_02771 [Desulfacinum hydrothermale DSM 13146]